MPAVILTGELIFPDTTLANEDGLLAIGGDLSPERLLLAYRNGIFPWYEGTHILWWCPDPRFVLFPDEIKTSKRVLDMIASNEFEFTTNKDFASVIHHCKNIHRPGQYGTWITDEVEIAYNTMHKLGHAHSAEVWKDGELVGGLYGIRIGKVFFGESMFSRVNHASRFAFTKYVQLLKEEKVELIDCQVYTDYLKSFGARMIPGKAFQDLLKQLT
jgi:leucyl/phenylalanyl-tRNA---protein transferase